MVLPFCVPVDEGACSFVPWCLSPNKKGRPPILRIEAARNECGRQKTQTRRARACAAAVVSDDRQAAVDYVRAASARPLSLSNVLIRCRSGSLVEVLAPPKSSETHTRGSGRRKPHKLPPHTRPFTCVRDIRGSNVVVAAAVSSPYQERACLRALVSDHTRTHAHLRKKKFRSR